MGKPYIMHFGRVFILFLSTQAVFSRTFNIKHKKDGRCELLHVLYQTTNMCYLDRDMYMKAKAHIILKENESNENCLDEPGTKGTDDKSFLMVTKSEPSKAREVYKVSIKSNTTEETGITMSGMVQSIAYDRKSNILFWVQTSGIFKQEVEFYSKKKRTSSQRNAADLNIYNHKIFYLLNKNGGYIYTHDPILKDNRNLWLSLQIMRIDNLVIDGNIGCWVQLRVEYSINCVEMSSKKKIYTRPLRHRGQPELALLQAENFGMLVFTERNSRNNYFIKVVEIFEGGQFGTPKTVSTVEKLRYINLVPGFLVYSITWSNKVEIWRMSQNGSVGRKAFSTRYPFSSDDLTVLVAFL